MIHDQKKQYKYLQDNPLDRSCRRMFQNSGSGLQDQNQSVPKEYLKSKGIQYIYTYPNLPIIPQIRKPAGAGLLLKSFGWVNYWPYIFSTFQFLFTHNPHTETFTYLFTRKVTACFSDFFCFSSEMGFPAQS